MSKHSLCKIYISFNDATLSGLLHLLHTDIKILSLHLYLSKTRPLDSAIQEFSSWYI